MTTYLHPVSILEYDLDVDNVLQIGSLPEFILNVNSQCRACDLT